MDIHTDYGFVVAGIRALVMLAMFRRVRNRRMVVMVTRSV